MRSQIKICALFKQHAQKRNIRRFQLFQLKIRVGLERAYPVDQFAGGRLFFHPTDIAQPVKRLQTGGGQVFVEIWKVNVDDFSHHITIRKGDMMKIAASQEGI